MSTDEKPLDVAGSGEGDEPAKVEQTGIYVLEDGTPVRLKEGDVLPEGATFRDAGDVQPQAGEERAKAAAPENRAKTSPPPEKREG